MLNNNETPIQIKGEKIILRNPVEDDIPHFIKWWKEPEGNSFDSGETDGPSDESVDKISNNIRNGLKTWFIIENQDKIPVGYTLYRQRESEKDKMFIATRLGMEFWNLGYGSDSVKTIVKWIFQNFPVKTIRLSVLDFNERAIHVYEKCGFKRIETVVEKGLNWIIMDVKRPD